jgi:multidrug resistance efflux pump
VSDTLTKVDVEAIQARAKAVRMPGQAWPILNDDVPALCSSWLAQDAALAALKAKLAEAEAQRDTAANACLQWKEKADRREALYLNSASQRDAASAEASRLRAACQDALDVIEILYDQQAMPDDSQLPKVASVRAALRPAAAPGDDAGLAAPGGQP